MRQYVVLMTVLLTCMLSLSTVAVAELRCGGSWIRTGDSREKILALCGEPTDVAASEYEVLERMYDPYAQQQITYPIRRTEETWIYDFGPGRLQYVLTFVYGQVFAIKTVQ
jgi:hypothetical protein